MSSVNSVSNTTVDSYYTQTAAAKSSSSAKKESAANSDAAAVYESSNSKGTQKTYKKDTATVQRLLQETEARKSQLKDLVEKTLGKQSNVFTASVFDQFKNGTATLSAEDIAKAKEDVSEDGYWGVKQTSERLYSFAYALAGGDPSKADEMMAAIEKGFQQATKSWGRELPDISKQTLEATREKINEWKNSSPLEQ